MKFETRFRKLILMLSVKLVYRSICLSVISSVDQIVIYAILLYGRSNGWSVS